MKAQEKLALLRKLFVNREDTYVVQWKTPEGEWRYWRVADGKGDDRKFIPLDDRALLRHMDLERTVGVYAMDELDRCKWICLDIDIKKGFEDENASALAQDTTKRLHDAIKAHAAQIPTVIEYSGSRGYHIWIFSEMMPATMARAIGVYFAQQVVPPNGIGIEVYPKSVVEGSIGSLVKLPLGRHQKTGHQCVLLNDTLTDTLPDPWLALSAVKPWPMNWWEKFMEMHDITEVESLRIDRTDVATRGLPCVTNILAQGAGKGQRDEAAFVVANFFIQHGLPTSTTLAALEEWNTRNEVPLSPQTLEVKVNSALRGHYGIYPCQRELLDPFCSSDCVFYANKMKTRGLA